MADDDYIYLPPPTVGENAPVVHYNKTQVGKKANLDEWKGCVATDEEEEAALWKGLAKNPRYCCQSILFGIMANSHVLEALMTPAGANRIFGPKEVVPKVLPKVEDENVGHPVVVAEHERILSVRVDEQGVAAKKLPREACM